MGKNKKRKKNKSALSVNLPEAPKEVIAEQSEYEKLKVEHQELTLRYNKEPNFIQKNAILLKITNLNSQMNSIEQSMPTSTGVNGNYLAASFNQQ